MRRTSIQVKFIEGQKKIRGKLIKVIEILYIENSSNS